MTNQRDSKADHSRVDELEREIERLRGEREEKRQEAADDEFAFATPEAYEAEQIADEQQRERHQQTDRADGRETADNDDPMEEPTPAPLGNLGRSLLESEDDDKSETEEVAERAADKRGS